jgi:hypothetical protein
MQDQAIARFQLRVATPVSSRRLPGRVRLLSTHRGRLTEQQKLVVFTKILLKVLEMAGDPRVDQVKAVIQDSVRMNRMGDPLYHPLQEAVKFRLRRTVGELIWAVATQHFVSYLHRRGL